MYIHEADGSQTAQIPADPASDPGHIVPDIVFYLHDVTVSDPSSPSYITNYSSHLCGGITAKKREIEKLAKYTHGVPDVVEENRFIPFGIEITGRLGPAARGLFVGFATTGPFINESKIRRYTGRLILLLMKWNAKKIMHGRQMIRSVPQENIITNSNIHDRIG